MKIERLRFLDRSKKYEPQWCGVFYIQNAMKMMPRSEGQLNGRWECQCHAHRSQFSRRMPMEKLAMHKINPNINRATGGEHEKRAKKKETFAQTRDEQHAHTHTAHTPNIKSNRHHKIYENQIRILCARWRENFIEWPPSAEEFMARPHAMSVYDLLLLFGVSVSFIIIAGLFSTSMC